MDISLTRDSQKLISVMYKHFYENWKSGISKSEANYFSDSHFIHEQLLPEWLFEDVDDTCRELSRAGLIICSWYDDIATDISISDAGIIYMENRFPNGIADILKFLSMFI